MKKRILSALTALALCLTLLPATAQAADAEHAHTHFLCGTDSCKWEDHTNADNKTTFDKWLTSALDTDAKSQVLRVGSEDGSTDGDPAQKDSSVDGWLLTAGTYYLKGEGSGKDVTIDKPIVIRSKVTICLNGKTLQSKDTNSGNPVFLIERNGELTLTDCRGGGQITRASYSKGQGSGVKVENGGIFNMYGGTITGNTADNGGGVCVNSGAFNMYGGTITGNTAPHGGGVYVAKSATFNMYGTSSVTNNKTDNSSGSSGAGVYVNGGTFTMKDGTISGNRTNSTDGGVGVYTTARFIMDGGTISGNEASQGGGVGVYHTARFIMNGGEITSNTATNKGGGVYVSGSGVYDSDSGNYNTFTMNNSASVSGNTAKNGGGVYVSVSGNDTFTMNGSASVTGNTTTDDKAGDANTAYNGGGVYVWGGTFNMNGTASIKSNIGNGVCVSDGVTFTVSGAPTVMGNTRQGAASNVFLAGSKTITIGGTLDEGARIGVTKTVYSLIADNVSEDYSRIFSSDDETREVKYEGGKLVLAKKSGGTTNPPVTTEHKHFLCGGKTACNEVGGHSCEATTFATKLWMDGGVLKKGNGDWTKGTVKRADRVNDSSEGYVLTAGSYYLENDLTLSGAAILIDGDVKLCLNGHTIDRANGNAALDYVIRVLGKDKAHLTLTDCVGGGKLTGGKYGGVDIFGFCTLDMFGGTITGNTNSGVDVGQFGEFNMYGGKITGNSAGYGGGVYTYGKFTMSGGSITNNTATEKGGGVLVDGGTFTVSGSATVKDNTSGQNSIKDNVSLADNKFITIGEGGLKSDASIGVTTATEPTKENPVFITNETNEGYKNSFTSDKAGFDVQFINKYNRLALVKSGGSTPGGGTPEIVPVSQITLNKTSTSISVGNSEKLTAKVTPENAANKRVTWTSSNENVATVDANGTVKALAVGTTTITATAEGDPSKSATCTVTVTGGTTPSQPGGSTGGTTGGSSSSGSGSYDSNPIIKTETKNNTDGSTTKTETRKDGSVTQTTTGKDGSVSKTETKKDGSSVTENKAADGSTGTVKTNKNGQTEANAKVSAKAVEDAKKNGEAVKAPVEVKASHDSSTAPTVKVELPKGAGETKVEIPVSNVKPGTVAVLVHPDGTEEILKDSIPTEDGIQLTVDGNATVKIVDNSKNFIDTRNHWAEDAIDFVSARGLVNGMSDTIYAPNNSATRAQLWTILARQNDANLSGGNTWYEKAQLWSKDKGISDGTEPNAAINRAQMVTMLWRTMGQPAATDKVSFADVPAGSYYAQAVAWAVESGITQGVGGGRFDPAATCTRAQIAAFLTRLYAEK